MAKMRRCIGSAKFGIEAHEAPAGSFPAQPSQKDGLGRMCKPHWNQYTSALRKSALARKAAEGGESGGTVKAAGKTLAAKPARARRSKTEHPMAHIPKASAKPPKEPRQPKPPKPESPRVRKAREVVAATESLEGRAYTDAIGSDEVQAALEGGGQDDTFEQDVRAILAEA